MTLLLIMTALLFRPKIKIMTRMTATVQKPLKEDGGIIAVTAQT